MSGRSRRLARPSCDGHQASQVGAVLHLDLNTSGRTASVGTLGRKQPAAPRPSPTHHTRLSVCSGGPSRSRTASIRSNPTGPYRARHVGGIVHRGTAPKAARRGTLRCSVVRCSVMWCTAVRCSAAHSRTCSHTHTCSTLSSVGMAKPQPTPGSARKKWAAFPLARGCKMQPRGTHPGAPRKIGQHFPLVTKGTPNSSRPLPEKRPAKNWAAFPLARGCKNKNHVSGTPGGTPQKILQHFPLCSTEALRRSMRLAGARGPRAAPPIPTPRHG